MNPNEENQNQNLDQNPSAALAHTPDLPASTEVEPTKAEASPCTIAGTIDDVRRVEILNNPTDWLVNRGSYATADVCEDVVALEVGVRTRTENPETKSGWSNSKTCLNFALDGATEGVVDGSYAWLARYGLGGILNKLTIALRKVKDEDGNPAALELDTAQVIRESELLAFFDVTAMEDLIKHIAPWETKARKKASARTAEALAACAVDEQFEERLAMAEGELAGFIKSILKTPKLELTAPEQASQLKAYKFLVGFIHAGKMKGNKPKLKVVQAVVKNLKALATMLRKAIATAQAEGIDPDAITGKIDTLETLDFLLCGSDRLIIELKDFYDAAAERRAAKAAKEGGDTEETYVDLIAGL